MVNLPLVGMRRFQEKVGILDRKWMREVGQVTVERYKNEL